MPKTVHPRLSVTFSQEAHDWLTAEAERRAMTVAELLRRIIDEVRGARVVPHPRSRGTERPP